MGIVTGLTAARMLAIEAASVVSGVISGDDLILTKHDNSTINAGNVRGPAGTSIRNRIINGDFSVNQRGFTSTTANATFGLDRWRLYCSGGTSTYSVQTPTLGDLPESAKFNARLVTSGQSAAGDYAQLSQSIESVRSLSGKSVRISFWAKASSGTPKVAIELNQGFGSGGSPSAGVLIYAGQVVLSTTWTRYSVTVSVPSISGKTIGTNINDTLQLNLWTSAGSTYNSRLGSMGIQNTTIDFWGVQVEEGSVLSPYEQEDYATNLRRCQRYYVSNLTNASQPPNRAIGMSTSRASCAVTFPVPMRVLPTVSIYSYAKTVNKLSLVGGSTDVGTTVSAPSTWTSLSEFSDIADSGTGFVANTHYWFYYVANAEY